MAERKLQRPTQRKRTLVKPKEKDSAGTSLMPASLTPSGAPNTAVVPKISMKRERIFIAADSYAGKGYQLMQLAQREYDKAIAAETPMKEAPRVYILDTEDGISGFLDEDGEFSHLYYINGGNVYPLIATSWADCMLYGAYIHKNAKQGDWVMIDTIRMLYAFAQRAYGITQGKDVDAEVIARQMSGKGFGAFDPGDWNVVKRMMTSILDPLFYSMPVNVVLTSQVRDNVDARMKREKQLLFDDMGMEPISPPDIPKMCDTILFLWNYLIIPKNEHNRRDPNGVTKVVRLCHVLKDRGKFVHDEQPMDKEFYPVMLEMRKAASGSSVNVTDEASVTKALEDAEEIRTADTMETDPTSPEPEKATA